MRKRVTLAGAALLPLIALSACQHDKQVEEIPPTPPPVERAPPPPPPLEPVTTAGDFRVAIELLEQGEIELAKRHLQREIEQLPENRTRRTRKLLAEIDADPQAYFAQTYGSRSFGYRVQPGDTLSSIARSYLGDPYSFYILGRYNEFDEYRRLEVGKTIRVPGRARERASGPTPAREPTPAPAPEPEQTPIAEPEPQPVSEPERDTVVAPPPRAETPALRASELIMQRKYREAIAILEPAVNERGNRGTLIDLYLEVARQEEAAGQLEAAKADLEKAQAIGSGNPTVVQRIRAVERKQQVNGLLRSAADAKAQGNADGGISYYRQVLAIDPDNAVAKNEEAVLTRQRIKELEREAESAQRRQELDQAMTAWRGVLELNGAHPRAQLKLDELQRLKDKLENRTE